MSFSELSSLSSSLIFTQPPYKRRKISDPMQDIFEKTDKRLAEPSDETGKPLKRRKIEMNPDVFDDKKSGLSDASFISKVRQGPQLDRFIPRAVSREFFEASSPLDTPYKKYLTAHLLGSMRPNDEKVLHFSSDIEMKKHPYKVSIHNPPPDSLKHQKFTVKKIYDVKELTDDFYDSAMAYNQHQDCLAVIRDLGVILKKGNLYHEVPFFFSSISSPSAVAFSPDGNALLVSMNSGELCHFDLLFERDLISSCHKWTNKDLSSEIFEQKHSFLVSDVHIFVGTYDGRVCKINRLTGGMDFFENDIDGSVSGLALSPDKKFLLTTTVVGKISLFDIENPRPLHQLQTVKSAVKAVAFSPCGRFFVLGGGGRDPRVVVFSIENQEVKEVSSHYVGFQTTAIFWRKDDILSTHEDGMIRTFLINPDHLSFVSQPKCHKTPAFGERLSYAALKHKKSSDVLFVGCGATDEIFEIKVQKLSQSEQIRSSSSSMHHTIR